MLSNGTFQVKKNTNVQKLQIRGFVICKAKLTDEYAREDEASIQTALH
jgi:hypothetical protein